MSSPLKQNTTALQELLDKINQLPEAGGSGGGGGSADWVVIAESSNNISVATSVEVRDI